MKCPFCGFIGNKVVDKRSVVGSGEIRRRRECLKCSKRFTTYERLGSIQFQVVKRDGRHEQFDREKLRLGIAKALEKRPGYIKVDEIVERIERILRKRGTKEVSSRTIGKIVLIELKKLDPVAYLRFVSVYRQFKQIEDFTKELITLTKYETKI